ncbi:MAG TPA: hypothetical protein VMG08_20755 [Allosphingosinicella sp.]|nr:hypothetical protein [Allosphingosinicella sp.]
MAGSSLLLNLARAAKVAALLFFLLPFVTVSCSSSDFAAAMGNQSGGAGLGAPPPGMQEDCVLITASGLDLAMGTASPSRSCFGAFADMGATETPRSEQTGPFAENDFAVIGAAAAILLALLLGFLLKGAAGALVGIVCSLGAVGAVAWSVFFRIPDAVFSALPQTGGGPQMTAEQARQIFSVNPGIGFWLMAGALLAAVILLILAMTKSRSPAPTGSPPPAG